MQSLPKVVIVSQHDIEPKLFSLRENSAIPLFRVCLLKLVGPRLNGSKVPNRVVEK
jgi:hypothetical protein